MRAKFSQEVSEEHYRPVPLQVSGQHFHSRTSWRVWIRAHFASWDVRDCRGRKYGVLFISNYVPRVLSLPFSREEERGPWERGWVFSWLRDKVLFQNKITSLELLTINLSNPILRLGIIIFSIKNLSHDFPSFQSII